MHLLPFYWIFVEFFWHSEKCRLQKCRKKRWTDGFLCVLLVCIRSISLSNFKKKKRGIFFKYITKLSVLFFPFSKSYLCSIILRFYYYYIYLFFYYLFFFVRIFMSSFLVCVFYQPNIDHDNTILICFLHQYYGNNIFMFVHANWLQILAPSISLWSTHFFLFLSFSFRLC